MRMGFRWFGEGNDTVSLDDIRQIPGVETIVWSLHDIAAGQAWPMEAIQATIMHIRGISEQGRARGVTKTFEADVVESVNIHESIKLGRAVHRLGRDEAIDNYITTIQRLGHSGVKVVCYNFMPVLDWLRTDLWYPLPDGSTATRDPEIADLAQRYRFADRFILTARGYSYPTAREAALKLMETSYVAAHAFSGADLLHGPVALIDHAYPVIAIARDDVGGRALESVIRTARARGGDVCAFGSPAAVSAAGLGLDVEMGTPTVSEDLAPIVDIAALQTLALHIALNRGLDPDAPRGLSKVTRTL